MDHVSVSPTDGIGPTQGQRKTLTRVGIEPTVTFGFDHHCSGHQVSYKVRQEQVLGSEDVNCTAMNMFKYSTRKGYVYYKRWPCSTSI